MTSKYNQKTINYVREHGFTVETVEKYNAFTKRRSDLYNIIDYLACNGQIILGVQSTSYNHKSDHKHKILKEPNTKLWLKSGGHLVLVTWRKNKAGTRYLPADVMQFLLVGGEVKPLQLDSLVDLIAPERKPFFMACRLLHRPYCLQ